MASLACKAPLAAGQILENIIFLGEVFGDKVDEEIPNVPFLELARSFRLAAVITRRENRPPVFERASALSQA